MTGQELVDQLKQQGFDNTDAEMLGWVDERQKEMVAAARARRQRLEIGPAVAEEQFYDLPDSIVEVYEVTVDGAAYGKAPHGSVAAAASSNLIWVGNGLFIVDASDLGANRLALLPPPSSGGAPIEVYAAVKADDLTLPSTVYVVDEFVRYLRYGAMATGWDLNAEAGDQSDRYEARFEQGVERYRRWVARRFRGSGPAQILVKGLNA